MWYRKEDQFTCERYTLNLWPQFWILRPLLYNKTSLLSIRLILKSWPYLQRSLPYSSRGNSFGHSRASLLWRDQGSLGKKWRRRISVRWRRLQEGMGRDYRSKEATDYKNRIICTTTTNSKRRAATKMDKCYWLIAFCIYQLYLRQVGVPSLPTTWKTGKTHRRPQPSPGTPASAPRRRGEATA